MSSQGPVPSPDHDVHVARHGLVEGPDPADRVGREELLSIIRMLPDVIFQCEKRADGKIYWTLNEGRLAEEFGLTTRQIEGKHLEQLFPGGASDVIKDHFEAAFRGEKDEWVNELGGRFFKHYPQPVHDEQGNVKSVVGFITEVTNLRLAQRQLEELSDELRRNVEELSLANKDLQTLNHTLSHDLRNPLMVIRAQGEILKMKLKAAGHDAAEARELETMMAAVRRMDDLLADIVRYSRIGLRSIAPERVDLSALAGRVAEQLQDSEPARCVRVQVATGLQGRMDPALARILLENLMGNAWKYTRDQDDPWIQVDQVEGPDGTWLRIRDNGIGFDDRESDQLFEPGARTEAAHAFMGSGIGLATVKRIVERHGGEIVAHGMPGQGAEFRVRLS